ncbi:serine/threonine-protein kinase 11-interacting protein-like [Limulus polyphemus]|uniref:Serine/threonine-protein kinase 11-interacting protein n=1 Tax=Limulus polyphemus TaxID=6850 RepID=A0ABM1SLE3_LIMPO|nr:serine/threonine-protein kinase 11-interacting protein-like [Limulus polyphemus]XP_022244449.1 serine/threonine-protein kinase 11-interacting protein-like [Limulus polyphemus]XP_022244450.1 serine/threonine-protein kinase 11-interacting protein-like [Limulus polyphemus]
MNEPLITKEKEDGVRQLAEFLRQNGDKVLNGQSKLSLTVTVIHTLNKLFNHLLSDNMEESSEVFCTSGSRLGFLYDLTFLCDFIKKTPRLKIIPSPQPVPSNVDISKFHNLKELEVKKVSLCIINGLQTLSPHLEVLQCYRSLASINDLYRELEHSKKEASQNGVLWGRLKKLYLSHNDLGDFENVVEKLPDLDVLDFSHNCMKTGENLKFLHRVTSLNLSFNQLTVVPVFSYQSCFTLRALSLQYNYLQDINGLAHLKLLQELDLSFNCLIEHKVLQPLLWLHHLNVLWLSGNPLSYHKDHRYLTSTFVSLDAVTTGILLDGKSLTKNEILKVLKKTQRRMGHSDLITSPTCVSMNTTVEDIESFNDTLSVGKNDEIYRDYNKDITFVKSEEQSVKSVETDERATESVNSIETEGKTRRKKTRKMREVHIPDLTDEMCTESMQKSETKINIPSCQLADHLQAKIALEKRRQYLDSEWLIGNMGQNRTPLAQSTPTCSLIQKDKPIKPLHVDLEDYPVHVSSTEGPFGNATNSAVIVGDHTTLQVDEVVNGNINNVVNNKNTENTGKEQISPEKKTLETSEDIEVLSYCDKKEQNDEKQYQVASQDEDSAFKSANSDSHCYMETKSSSDDAGFIWNRMTSMDDENILSPDDDFWDNDVEATLFIVQKLDGEKSVTMFISIIGQCIKEKNVLTGKLEDSLDLRSLLLVEKMDEKKDSSGKPKVHLTFDSLKKSRRERVYHMEDLDSAEAFVGIVKPFVDARVFQEMTKGALQCQKCLAEFSKDVAKRKLVKVSGPVEMQHLKNIYSNKEYHSEVEVCPNCESTVVVQLDSCPLPAAERPTTLQVSSHFMPQKTAHSSDSASHLSSSPRKFSSDIYGKNFNTDNGSKSLPYGSRVISCSPNLRYKKYSHGRSVSLDFQDDGEDKKDQMKPTKSSSETSSLVSSEVVLDPVCSSVLKHREDFKRSSSDITILSNPSQSSIAVISSSSSEQAVQGLEVISEKSSVCSPVASPHHISDFSKLDTSNYPGVTRNRYRSLTAESVSSGSMTSSVCTTIQTGKPSDTDLAIITPENAGSKKSYNASLLEASQCTNSSDNTSSVSSEISAIPEVPFDSVGTKQNQDNIEVKDTNKCEAQSSRVIEGNDESRISLSHNINIWSMLSEGTRVSHNDFVQIDHRLKLYLEVYVLGREEEVTGMLKAGLVLHSSLEEVSGLLVLSETQLYILLRNGSEDSDPDSSLQVVDIKPLKKLSKITILCGSQGFWLTWGGDGFWILCLLKDADYCNCFISFLSDLIKKDTLLSNDSIVIETSAEQSLIQLTEQVLLWKPEGSEFHQTDCDTEVLLYLMGYWAEVAKLEKMERCMSTSQPVVLVVTQTDICVARICFRKSHMSQPVTYYEPLNRQKISNLIEVVIRDNLLCVKLSFLDEDSGQEFYWIIGTQTKTSLGTFLNVIKGPWEALFEVELQLTLEENVKS